MNNFSKSPNLRRVFDEILRFERWLGFSGWSFPGFFPLGIPKVQRFANLVDLEKMLQNAYFDAKIGFDTEENGPF